MDRHGDKPKLRGYKATPQSKRSLRGIALSARQKLDLGDGAIDGAALLEKLVLFGITYDIVEDSFLLDFGGVEASWRPDELCMHVTDSTYRRLAQGNGRALFTICHEIGHVLLHNNIPALLHRNAAPPSHKLYEDTEWQADTFAAEFAMPLHVILNERIVTADGIQRRFRVSAQAAEIRFKALKTERRL